MTNPKDETQRTHWEGCWKTYGHHDCAVERVAELEAELEAEIEARGPVAVTRRVDLTVEALQAQLAELQGKLAYAEAPHEWAANRIQELEAQLAERDARIAELTRLFLKHGEHHGMCAGENRPHPHCIFCRDMAHLGLCAAKEPQ